MDTITTHSISNQAPTSMVQAQNPSPITLYPYQVEAVNFFRMQGKGILADECGLGKTITAVNYGLEIPSLKLIVCPKKSKLWWITAIYQQDIKADIVLTGNAGYFTDEEIKPDGDQWIITHYEGLRKNIEGFGKYTYGLVICDEAHRFRNHKTLLARTVKSLLARRRIALTATPMEHGAQDLWSLVDWVYNGKYLTYYQYVTKYLQSKSGPWGTRIVGLKPYMREYFHEDMKKVVLTRTKAEVAPQLPPKIITVVPVELSPEQRELYNRIAFEEEIDLTILEEVPTQLFINGTLARITRLLQACTDPLLFRAPMEGAKSEWVDEWLEDHPETPVVIMTNFREVAMNIAQKHNAALIIGGVDEGPELEKWHSGKTNVLVCTIKAGGESLNLQHASTMIFVDMIWSATKMTQAEDRIHRITNTEPKQIYRLVATKTVDQLVLAAVENKWDATELVKQYIKRSLKHDARGSQTTN